MIHVITKSNASLYRPQLEEHFRIRHDIYVRERKWMALERPDEREIDQFDTKHAVYLLALEGDEVVGGTRLVPTEQPHLMSDVFPHLAAERGVPRGPDIMEWTRIFVVRHRRGGDSTVLHRVLAGMLEYCLEEGVEHLSVVMETWWMPRFMALGWDFAPLGLPEPVDDMEVVATKIRVTEDALASTLAAKNLSGSMLVRRLGPRSTKREPLQLKA